MSKKILVVDDEPYIVRSLTYVLGKGGYECSIATDGEEALNQIKKNKPDLIFLDIMLPKVDGYEVCKQIKNNPDLKDIYVIMLSAKGQAAEKEKGFSVGADEYMTKPFSPTNITQRVKEIFEV